MGTTTTTFALNKPTVGGDDNAWGTDLNANADKLDDLLDGTTAIKPNLSEGLWKVGGVAVTATAAELNILDGANPTFAPAFLANPQRYLDPENRIINGAFDFWQRGASFTTLVYGADRWINTVVGGTVTMSRQAFTIGDTLGSNNPTFFLRQSVSGQSLASHAANVTQRIEGVRIYAGQTITLLGWARRSSGSGNMAVDGFQLFGTGGSPSAVVNLTPQTITLTGSWAPFAVTFSVPSVSGKTLGTNGDDCLAVRFWTSAGSDFNTFTNSLGLQTIAVDLWGIHIKVGTHTTAAVDLYRAPERGAELARCQRYFSMTYAQGVIPGTVTTAGAIGSPNATTTSIYGSLTSVFFPVEMRRLPSFVYYNPITGAVGTWRANAIDYAVSDASFIPSTRSTVVGNSAVAIPIVGTILYGHLTADAEL